MPAGCTHSVRDSTDLITTDISSIPKIKHSTSSYQLRSPQPLPQTHAPPLSGVLRAYNLYRRDPGPQILHPFPSSSKCKAPHLWRRSGLHCQCAQLQQPRQPVVPAPPQQTVDAFAVAEVRQLAVRAAQHEAPDENVLRCVRVRRPTQRDEYAPHAWTDFARWVLWCHQGAAVTAFIKEYTTVTGLES